MNNRQKIKFDCGVYSNYVYCTFSLEGNLILFYNDDKNTVIFIYSTQTNNNKWNCKRIYKIPKDYKDFIFISITKYDKLYLFSNNLTNYSLYRSNTAES
jgi:hypothetical protein